jgi:hypothetical protein
VQIKIMFFSLFSIELFYFGALKLLKIYINPKLMKKVLALASALFLIAFHSNAQIEVDKLVGKNSGSYGIGFGLFLQFAVPVSDAADITAEGGAIIFFEKGDNSEGVAAVPVKIGYRYTLNGEGDGFYIHPQVGYNVYGVKSEDFTGYNVDSKFHGIILSAGTGYIFNIGGTSLDIGIRYETILANGSSVNYVGLRIAHTFSFGSRRNDY